LHRRLVQGDEIRSSSETLKSEVQNDEAATLLKAYQKFYLEFGNDEYRTDIKSMFQDIPNTTLLGIHSRFLKELAKFVTNELCKPHSGDSSRVASIKQDVIRAIQPDEDPTSSAMRHYMEMQRDLVSGSGQTKEVEFWEALSKSRTAVDRISIYQGMYERAMYYPDIVSPGVRQCQLPQT